MPYIMKKHPDGMRWSVHKDGKEYGTYNSRKVAEREKRRLNGEPPEQEEDRTCLRFDADGLTAFLICSSCHDEIHDGGFYYKRGKSVVCAVCAEGADA